MQKRTLFVSLLVISALLVSAVLGACEPAPPEKVTWRFNVFTSAVDAYPSTQFGADMAERVKQRTDGNFVIEVYTSGALGIKSGDFLKACSAGAIDGFVNSGGTMSGDIPAFDPPYLPYLGRTTTDKKKMDDVLRPIYTADLAERNVEPLVTATWGFTYPMLTKALPSLFDWSGIKMRVINPWQTRMISNMGGEGVAIARAEVYTALTRGVVDGENGSVPTLEMFPDRQLYQYIYVLNVGMGVWTHIYNKDSIAALPDEYRDILYEEAAKTEEEAWGIMVPIDVNEERILKEQQEKYGTTVYRATEAELNQLAEMNKSIWDEWAKERGTQDILSKVKDALGYA